MPPKKSRPRSTRPVREEEHYDPNELEDSDKEELDDKEERPMEAKVDVRKLQVLNDRINQTIDALNQVRLSVHGLGHTAMQGNPIHSLGLMGQGLGMQQPFGGGSVLPGIGGIGSPFQQGFGGGFGGGLGGGLGGVQGFQHSPFTNPYLTNPYMNPILQQLYSPWNVGQNPFLAQGIGGSPYGSIGQSPWGGGGGFGGIGGGGFGGGLFHSTQDVIERQLIEARAADPYRITQTFPFVVT